MSLFIGNPFLGVVLHWIGGLACGSFYVPYRGAKNWSSETDRLVGRLCSWIILPWGFALAMTEDLFGVLRQQWAGTLGWTYFFGAIGGIGGLTFGLTMRYLGISLSMGGALGYCASFGTLLPPLFKTFIPAIPVPETIAQIAATTAGQLTLGGVAVGPAGIGLAALAGLTKEMEMPEAEKKQAISEFNFSKGIIVATFSGIMSAGFSFALTAGAAFSVAVALATHLTVPLFWNYFFAALAASHGVFSVLLLHHAEPQMRRFGSASSTLPMAGIIIFSTMWGRIFRERKGASTKAHRLIASGMVALILSTVIIGSGTWLRGQAGVGQ